MHGSYIHNKLHVYYHYTKHTFVRSCVCVCVCVYVCVCVSERLPEAVRPRLISFFFFAKLQMDATSGIPPTLPTKALAPG